MRETARPAGSSVGWGQRGRVLGYTLLSGEIHVGWASHEHLLRVCFMRLSSARGASVALVLLVGVNYADSVNFGGKAPAGKTRKKQVPMICKLQWRPMFFFKQRNSAKLHTHGAGSPISLTGCLFFMRGVDGGGLPSSRCRSR